jgi:hypothetical protein
MGACWSGPSVRRRPRWPVRGYLRSGSSPSSGRFRSSLGITIGAGPDPHGPARHRSPVSSWTSRSAAWASVSPGWSLPLGTTSRHRPAGGQDDLDPAALAAAPDDPAAGPNDRLGHDRPPRWVERARQAVGHRALRRGRGRGRRGGRGEGWRRSASLRGPGPGSPVAAPASTPPSPSVASPGSLRSAAASHLLLVAGGGRISAATSASVGSTRSPFVAHVTTRLCAGGQSVTTPAGGR